MLKKWLEIDCLFIEIQWFWWMLFKFKSLMFLFRFVIKWLKNVHIITVLK